MAQGITAGTPEYAQAMGAQMVYNALMAFVVEYHRAHIAEARDTYRQAREHGQGDMVIQAAMVAFGEDRDAAELRVSEDYQERMAAQD